MKLMFLLSLLYALPIQAEIVHGKITKVSDGDTLTLYRDGKNQLKVRLYGIDSPEKAQDFGMKAKEFTLRYASKQASVEIVDRDRYGRAVGIVTVDKENINRELVSQGLAWVYKQYCKKEPLCGELVKLEAEAKAKKKGLFSTHAVEPWNFRKNRSNQRVALSPVGKDLKCNHKSKVCHQPGCRHYNCKNCTIRFKTGKEAQAQGYRLSSRCN